MSARSVCRRGRWGQRINGVDEVGRWMMGVSGVEQGRAGLGEAPSRRRATTDGTTTTDENDDDGWDDDDDDGRDLARGAPGGV